MKQRHIKQSSVLALFVGVAIVADIIPWPGLGAGLIQTMSQGVFSRKNSVEQVFNSQKASPASEITSQNSLSLSPGNGG